MYRYDKGPIISGIPTAGYQLRANIRKVMDNGTLTFYAQYINDQVQFYSPYHLTADRKLPKGWNGEDINTMMTDDVSNLSVKTPNGYYQSRAGSFVTTKGGYVMGDLQHNFGSDWKLSVKLRSATYQHEFNFFNTDGNGRNPLSQATFAATVLPAGSSAPVFSYANDNTAVPANALVLENIIVDRNRPINEIAGQMNISKAFNGESTKQTITLGTFLSHTNSIDYNVQLRYLSEYKDRPRVLNLRYGNGPFAAVYTTNGVVNVPGYTNKDLTSNRVAVYLTDEMNFGALNLDLGFRYEAHEGRVLIEKAANAANADGRIVSWGTGAFDKINLLADDWAAAIGASYRIASSFSVYGNFSRGYFFPEYRGYSVRYNSQTGLPLYPVEKPEHIIQGELGTKLGYKTLTATLAGYYVELKDRYAVNLTSIGGSLKETQNLQSSRSYGIEATYDWELLRALHFSGSFTYQNATYTVFVDSSTATPINNEGKWLERQPRTMFSPSLFFDNRKFFASLTADYVSKRYGNAANLVELDPYTLVRFDVAYTFALNNNESFRIAAGIFNLLDSEAVTEGNPRAGNTQTNTGDYFVGRVSLPRAFYVRLGFNF
jgi:iron complex outermembrane receptor protein